MRELFIYWRTATSAADAAERATAAWQAALRVEFPDLQVALYRRADEGGPSTTLMETYAGAALDAALEQRISSEGDARLGPWLRGLRKVEVFVRRPLEPSD